jgi:hypothetical protein
VPYYIANLIIYISSLETYLIIYIIGVKKEGLDT